ncbi:DUF2584 family protein [Reinekea blandensis]|uniref:Uncharacterized protein n=1 Tax=Reinekea blandensis MED297 TaxID=314283 RepID=A4BFB6_9GAMM|nr:DUF2584 family protein [Reinekea blandensis]EAR09229.1 hypothetical protein MED297_07098 [Reinekea sp. MED297] [Reinekea blandensis MED297]
MGFPVTFNWVLQIPLEEPLLKGQRYPFEKAGNRVFPLLTPIDLIDPQRTAIAKIQILSFQNMPSQTRGEFQVLKRYEGVERDVLTQYWIENQA